MNKNELQGYTIKFSKETWRDIKIFVAMNGTLTYQYELFNAAVNYIDRSGIELTPIANPLEGKHRTCYIDEKLMWTVSKIAEKINCNPSRALYSIILKYLDINAEATLRNSLNPEHIAILSSS
jgi:hypothetical protein